MKRNKQRRNHRRTSLLTVSLVCGLGLGVAGCVPATPVVTKEANTMTDMTLDELRAWMEERLDDAVFVSGIGSGWKWVGAEPAVYWTEQSADRELILESLFPEGCGELAGRLDASFVSLEVADPRAAAAAVREHWEREGWAVTDVRDYAQEELPYFRADREDGAVLSFEAAETGVALSARTPCSAHTSVSLWHRNPSDPNDLTGTEADEGAAGHRDRSGE